MGLHLVKLEKHGTMNEYISMRMMNIPVRFSDFARLILVSSPPPLILVLDIRNNNFSSLLHSITSVIIFNRFHKQW